MMDEDMLAMTIVEETVGDVLYIVGSRTH